MATQRCRHLAWKMKSKGKEFHLVVRNVALKPAKLMSVWKRSGSQGSCWLIGITLLVGEFEIMGKEREDWGIQAKREQTVSEARGAEALDVITKKNDPTSNKD